MGSDRALRRRAPPLTTRQRTAISLSSAAAGLLCAWLIWGGRGGGGGLPSAALRAEQKSHQHSLAEVAGDREKQQKPTQQQQQQQVQQEQQQQQQQQAGAKQAASAKQAAGGAARPRKQQQDEQRVGMEDEREWFNKLSAEGCRRAEQLRICSHRGRLAVEGVAPGSLSAYSVLYKAGVRCFDADFVQTADGQLLATHPDDLAAALSQGKQSGGDGDASLAIVRGRVQERSLAELRAAGVDEERFPAADALIKVFAALLEETGLLWRRGKPDYEKLPVLLMDVKEDAFSQEAIDGAAEAARTVGATPHVALFVSNLEQLTLVRNGTHWRGPLIRAFQDQQDSNPLVSAEALADFQLLGPSIKMSDAFLAAAGSLGKPQLAWTVDSPADLHRGLEAGLNAVISNRALALRAVLLDWRDRCSERQRRQLRHARRQAGRQ